MGGRPEPVSAGDRVRVASAVSLKEGCLLPAQAEGIEIVLVRHRGTVFAYQGRCPHRGTLLAEGTVDAGILTCRGHGWRFDCASGVKVDQPDVCLRGFTASVAGPDVLLNRGEVLAWKHEAADSCRPEPQAATGAPARSLLQLPGPTGLPWLGNVLQLHKAQLHVDLERWCDAFGPIYRINLLRRPVVVVAHGEWIDRILHDRPETFRRARAIEALSREIGSVGVFSAEGADWRRHRRPVAQALDARHLRDFFPTLAIVTLRLKRRWEKAATGKRPVDVQQDLMRYTVDVTTSLAFGYDMNTLECEGGVIQQHLVQILPMIDRRVNAPFPYWHYFRLPADRAYDRAVQAAREAIGEFIAAARQRLAQSPALAAHPNNFLEAMIAAQAAGEAPLSDDELYANIFTMLLAGEDTTANTIAWMMHFMCLHPEVQRKMQQEADAVLGEDDVLRDIGDATRLAYIDAVAQESLRLKPVAPLFFLEPNEDVEIGGYRLPRGTSIMLLTRPDALRESNFAAAHEFRPERWLDDSAAAHHRSGFLPFGSGPRLCPGRSLALLEIKAALSMVCRQFTLSHAPGSGPVDESFGFTMTPTGLRVVFAGRPANN